LSQIIDTLLTKNFLHHFHDELDNVASSNLSWNVIADLPEVMSEIQRILSI